MRLTRRSVFVAAVAATAAVTTPTASAAGPKSGPLKTADVRVAQIERQFCAVEPMTGRGIDRINLKSPVNGTISVRTRSKRGAEWDLALVDRKRNIVLAGSAQVGAREYLSTFVRKGQRLALQTCRQDGSSRLAMQYRFTKLPKAKASNFKTKLVRVTITGTASKNKLASLGLDLTDHPHETYWDALLHSKRDVAKLKKSGLSYSVRIGDVARKDRANRRAEARRTDRVAGAKARASAIPSGRTSYRTLEEIETDLRALVAANPGLVRLVTLPGRSWMGREIYGVEIAENVNATDDGRPANIMVGTHHAREWPANEATLEWGLDLVAGYKAGNPRITGIVTGARNFIVPVLNVDGFDVTIRSEGLTPGGNYVDPGNSTTSPTGSGNTSAATGAYKRKNCRPEDGVTPPVGDDCLNRSYPNIAANADDGVDLNRNYGVEWGGPGTGTLPYPSPNFQTQHGPEPFSEPETRAFRDFVRDLQPSVLITNHTYTGLLLRPPGTNRFGPVPDEERLRFLGDRMADQTNYISQYSYQLYDTTGTTDDYLYDGLGAFSYTPEIGKNEFHPEYTEFIAEYEGQPAVDRFGEPLGYQLGGLREAYILAGETAVDPGSHSVIQGTAPAGRTLRIRKTITYRTSEDPDDDGVQYPVQTINEPRNSTTTVKPNGTFEWHVNPSRQPRDFSDQPDFWTLTCEDGQGNVLETRNVYVERAGRVNVALKCGGPDPAPPTEQEACPLPNGFKKVGVTRRGGGLRFTFEREVSNGVTIEVFQTSKGRNAFAKPKRVARFRNRSRGLTWNGKSKGKRLPAGVYYARFRIQDEDKRIDSRRIVLERKNGRFTKRGKFELEEHRCG